MADLSTVDTDDIIKELGGRFDSIVLYGFLSANKTKKGHDFRQAVKSSNNSILELLGMTEMLKDEIKRLYSTTTNP